RPTVPLTAISLVLRWRRRRGDRALAGHYHHFDYAYFLLCLVAAGVRENRLDWYYLAGLVGLVVWALWSVRSVRYRWPVFLLALVCMLVIGLAGIYGVQKAQRLVQNFNAAWMSRLFGNRTDPLQSLTSMGRIGNLKLSANPVIWVEPHEAGRFPSYLREASYRNYQPLKMSWFAGGPHDFDTVVAETNATTWYLVRGKKNADAITITCFLNGREPKSGDPEGLLPLPFGTGKLENLQAIEVKANPLGAVLASGLGLVIFDAHYGPGASLDGPPDGTGTNRFDYLVPPEEQPAINQVLAEMQIPGTATEAEKLERVERFFFDKFTYSLWQGFDKKKDQEHTPLTKFLTTSRSGHCEYFATATVLLLRQLGIPARYAVGYYVHEAEHTGFVVRDRDAHAWCLVWNEKTKNWMDFDTTPPSWVSLESGRTKSAEWFADLSAWVKLQYAKFRWRQSNWQQYLLWALVPVLVVLLFHIIFRRRGKVQTGTRDKGRGQVADWPGLDSEYYGLEQAIAARGLPRLPGESQLDWLNRALIDPSLADLRPTLWEVVQLHYRHRFDPLGLAPAQRAELAAKSESAREQLNRRRSKS
ncbi:MAG TPA: transglutaminase domain-containing protein, partial [Verrucomicrobiae bacterium]